MGYNDNQYWPFDPESDFPLLEQYQIEFLRDAYDQGYESFCLDLDDCGARSNTRSGIILVRGRTRWEMRLDNERQRVLRAYVDDYNVCAKAIVDWLDGVSAKEILERIQDHLITLPGAKASHVLNEE